VLFFSLLFDVCCFEQGFLDGSQYTEKAIGNYETVFGKKFVSVGGAVTTRQFIHKLNLHHGNEHENENEENSEQRVLDVGCGLGGAAFCIAELFGAHVLGLEVSTNMISKANDYKSQLNPHIQNLVRQKGNNYLPISPRILSPISTKRYILYFIVVSV
jgi:ubiquinone/menaquinone biosynthesis C-methylase UbiE